MFITQNSQSSSYNILSPLILNYYCEFTFPPHMQRLIRDCYYQLRQLRIVTRSLTASAAITLVYAFIIAWLDYCSNLYTGLTGCLVLIACPAEHRV